MRAAVYYTFYSSDQYGQKALRGRDKERLSLLLRKIESDGNSLWGIYMSDRTSTLTVSLRALVKRDAVCGRFDVLYLYVYDTPISMSASRLLDILNLPVDGRGSIFD